MCSADAQGYCDEEALRKELQLKLERASGPLAAIPSLETASPAALARLKRVSSSYVHYVHILKHIQDPNGDQQQVKRVRPDCDLEDTPIEGGEAPSESRRGSAFDADHRIPARCAWKDPVPVRDYSGLDYCSGYSGCEYGGFEHGLQFYQSAEPILIEQTATCITAMVTAVLSKFHKRRIK